MVYHETRALLFRKERIIRKESIEARILEKRGVRKTCFSKVLVQYEPIGQESTVTYWSSIFHINKDKDILIFY